MTLIDEDGDLNVYDRVNMRSYQAAEMSDGGQHKLAVALLRELLKLVEEWLKDEESKVPQ